jgi:hypothetical protein
MDGTHWIPIEGAPDLVDSIRLADTAGFAGWSTAPLPLATPYGCAVGTRTGRVYVFGDKGEQKTIIDLPEREFVDQLLTADGALIAITASGAIRSYSYDGKQVWNATPGPTSAAAVIVNGLLVVPTREAIIALGLRDGKERWRMGTSLPTASLAVSRDLEWIAAAISFNESGRQDSVIALHALNGQRAAAYAVAGGRITSNLAIAGKDNELLVYGALGSADDAGRAATFAAIRDWNSDKHREAWSHPIPYIILSASANSDKAFASGFRNTQGELVSGIDAFKLSDTSFVWKRRFTEPLMAAPAVSEGNLFFTLSFETEAIVGARALLYTLRSGSGETVSERPLKASSGALPAMPIPDEQGRLLVADAERPVVYALDRSTLKRVF